jgi:hypothetical protein
VYRNRRVYTKNCCIPSGDHELKCKDSYGDGWNGGYIEIDGIAYCKKFRSGREFTSSVNIGAAGLFLTK